MIHWTMTRIRRRPPPPSLPQSSPQRHSMATTRLLRCSWRGLAMVVALAINTSMLTITAPFASAFVVAPWTTASRHNMRLSAGRMVVPPPPPPPPPPVVVASEEDLMQKLLEQLTDRLSSLSLPNGEGFGSVSITTTPSMPSGVLESIQTSVQTLLSSLEQMTASMKAAASMAPIDGIALPESLVALLQSLSAQLSLLLSPLTAILPASVLSLTLPAPLVTILLVTASTLLSFTIVSALLRIGQGPPPTQPYPMLKYDALAARAYFDRQWPMVIGRSIEIARQSLTFGWNVWMDQVQNKVEQNEYQRGRELAALLTQLGPTYIKVGQSLSIRTDLLSPAYIRGLETLQDQVPSFDTKVAQQILQAEWGRPISDILTSDLTDKPVAAASLGQVYKATLRDSNQVVAIKVQRPNIMVQIALDMHLLREFGALVKRIFPWINTDTVGTVDVWGAGFVDELDYVQEAINGETFSAQIATTPLKDVVFAPRVVPDYSTRTVLVTEWVDGERLDQSNSADISVLCSIAMNTYLTMLLELGVLHCDPHPGNLLRTTDGKLCILDFGMVTRLDKNLQLTLIEHMAHLTSADYGELPRDLLLLGFVPEDKADVIGDSGVVELLAEIYGAWTSGGGVAAINVNKVIAQLQDLTAQKGNLFRIPPYFAYIAKSFSVLEGIGLSNDPKYSIINECLPYVSKRLLTDKDRMGPALSTFIFGPDKANADRIVDYKRVEQLVEGFGEYSTSASGALLGKENISRSILLEEAADQVLDLVFTEEETPLQQIVLEQMAKIISATSRTVWTELRERSGMLPSGRTRLGTLIDPLGLWRTSPLVRTNELDEKTVETTQKLIDLMRRQVQDSDNPLFNALSREDTLQFASILVRKVWAKRSGVVQTSSRFARILLQLTADQLERGERDSRRLPLRRIPPSTADSTATPEAATTGSGLSSTPSLPSSSSPETSQRLQGARRLLEEVRQHQQEVTSQPTLVSTGAKPESNRLAGARKMLRDLQNDDA